MPSEPDVRDALQRLLEPLSPSWVAEQIGVSRQQVDRWKNGHYTSPDRLEQVARAVRALLPEHKEEAPPRWAGQLKDDAVGELKDYTRGLADELQQAIQTGGMDDLVARAIARALPQLLELQRESDGSESGEDQVVADERG